MIRFFRENKSTRDSVIGVVAVLFCISAIFGGAQYAKSGLSVGKRQVNTQRLQAQFQQIVKHHPDIDKKLLEQDLITQALSSLKQSQYIENIGLIPTAKRVKQTLTEILPKNISLKTVAKEQHLNQNQLLLSISDQIAYQQFVQSIESTSIVTPEQQKLHTGALTQVRTYIDIDLTNGTYPEDPEAYQALYAQKNLQHPKVYHYRYVTVTPSTLQLPPVTESMIMNYFNENHEQYADQEFEYQVTTYVPSKSGQTNHKVWPEYIQNELTKFTEEHPTSRVNTKTFKAKRSALNKDHRIIEKLQPLQHYILDNDNTFSVVSLIKKETSHSIDPNLRSTLKANLEASHYSHLLQKKLSELSEYAYTHPTDLEDFAQTFGLTVETKSTSDVEYISGLLSDTDFIGNHYISDAVQVGDLEHQFIQIIEITPQSTKSYEEALDEIKALYEHNVLYPNIIAELDQAKDMAEIEAICDKYQLSYDTHSTKDRPSEQIFGLVPNRDNPNPSTTAGLHWQRLEKIEHEEHQEDMSILAQKLDGEILLSTLRNAS